MIFDGFKIAASPFIHDAYCKCGHELTEVSNGVFSRALFCSKCENVYELRLIKVPFNKISTDFLEQCRKQSKK